MEQCWSPWAFLCVFVGAFITVVILLFFWSKTQNMVRTHVEEQTSFAADSARTLARWRARQGRKRALVPLFVVDKAQQFKADQVSGSGTISLAINPDGQDMVAVPVINCVASANETMIFDLVDLDTHPFESTVSSAEADVANSSMARPWIQVRPLRRSEREEGHTALNIPGSMS